MRFGKAIFILLICVLACVGVVSADFIPPITDGGITAKLTTGNPVCGPTGPNGEPGLNCGTEFKVETTTPNVGYGKEWCIDSTNCVTITVLAHDADGVKETGIKWESNFPVQCVFMKDGLSAGNLYCYDNPATTGVIETSKGDKVLYTNNAASGNPGGISHILFCYDAGGLNPPPIPSPEFPTFALPLGMLIGVVGLVYHIKSREK